MGDCEEEGSDNTGSVEAHSGSSSRVNLVVVAVALLMFYFTSLTD